MSDPTQTPNDTTSASFLKSKFDNICLIFLTVFGISLLTWVDKHGNGDYEKWLEVLIAGIVGAYLGLISGARQSWKTTSQSTPNGNGNSVSTSSVEGQTSK